MTDIKKIEENIDLLIKGWREKVEYYKPVDYGDQGIIKEKRVKHVRRPGLIEQLAQYAKHADTGAEPKSERGVPGKQKSRPPANMAGFHLLDEITVEANTLIDRVVREAGRSADIGTLPLRDTLATLPYQCRQIIDSHPPLVDDIAHAVHTWVDRAQRVLGLKTSEAMFADTVCDCGGALAVGRDVMRTDVRCAGSPSAPSCGKRYGPADWLRLAQGV